jgi:hypothetical protein
MKNTLLLLFLIVSSFISFGQEKKVNNYKYIIVSEKFNAFKERDQYQTSSLTKFLLKKNGFTVILDSEEYPLELQKDPCLGLNANIEDKSTMLKTKVFIELIDCSNKVVFTSNVGESKFKEYKKSFQEAIRNAHKSMVGIKYLALKNEKKIDAKRHSEADTSQVTIKSENENNIAVLPLENKVEKASPNKDEKLTTTLYAQPVENGYQLINLKPEVVFLILNTNIKDVFIIKDKNGLLYKKEATWVAEFYENGRLSVKKYQIKF